MDLVQLTAPAIRQQNSNMGDCVSAEERILITLKVRNVIFILRKCLTKVFN
jgi:hypothetical protein